MYPTFPYSASPNSTLSWTPVYSGITLTMESEANNNFGDWSMLSIETISEDTNTVSASTTLPASSDAQEILDEKYLTMTILDIKTSVQTQGIPFCRYEYFKDFDHVADDIEVVLEDMRCEGASVKKQLVAAEEALTIIKLNLANLSDKEIFNVYNDYLSAKAEIYICEHIRVDDKLKRLHKYCIELLDQQIRQLLCRQYNVRDLISLGREIDNEYKVADSHSVPYALSNRTDNFYKDLAHIIELKKTGIKNIKFLMRKYNIPKLVKILSGSDIVNSWNNI